MWDPDFDDDDFEAAIAWQQDKTGRCSRGHVLAETTRKGRDQDFDAEPVVCHACAAVDRAIRAHHNEKHDDAGVLWMLTERDPREAVDD